MEQIILNHNIFFKKEQYKIIDPNKKSNELNGIILTQEEICQNILSFDFIDILYNNIYLIRYNIKSDKIIIEPIEFNSYHLLRQIMIQKKLQFEFNFEIEQLFLPDILINLNLLLNNNNIITPKDYCCLCGNILSIKGLEKITCCKNQYCMNKFQVESMHMVLDNKITDLYQKDKILLDFLINILIEGTVHPKKEKIFKPLPKLNGINNLDELIALLNNEINYNNLNLEKIDKCNNDIELIKLIGNKSYGIINNAISNNYFSLSSINIFPSNLNYNINKFSASSIFELNDIKIIGLNYTFEVENRFKKEYFLFHGSPTCSWYPIIKNGLKVMSGTEFMTTGSAYGNGIYFSDNFSLSYGYTSYRSNIYYKNNQNNKRIVGVFEINDNIAKYKKTEQIYVIDDEKIILLRFLIIINNSYNLSSDNCLELSNYFVKYLGSINKQNEKKIINIKNKRLNAEIKLLNSNKNIQCTEIIDEIKNWKIKLVDIKNNNVELNVFFNDYPILPPKILLNSNINNNIICDIGTNNVQLQELSPSGWDVTFNLSKLIDKIYNCISNSI